MFNLGPEKLVVIALVALVVLGPHRLPDAARKAGKVIRDLRELSGRVQSEVQQAFEEHTGTSAVEAISTLRSMTAGPLGPVRSGMNAALAAVSAPAPTEPAPTEPAPTEPAPTEPAPTVKRAAPKKTAAPARRTTAVKAAHASPKAARTSVAKKAPAPKRSPSGKT